MDNDRLKDLKTIFKKQFKEEIVTMDSMKRSDKNSFGNLQTSLNNSYLLGKNECPKMIAEVLKVLNN